MSGKWAKKRIMRYQTKRAYLTITQIKFIHENKGKMTQHEIAAAIGKSVTTVNNHINGYVTNIRTNLEITTPKRVPKPYTPHSMRYGMPDKKYFDDKDFPGIW